MSEDIDVKHAQIAMIHARRFSNAYPFLLMYYHILSITTPTLRSTRVNQQWPLYIFNLKSVALLSCRKTMHAFLDAGSNPDSAFVFYASYFHIMFQSIAVFTFIMSSDHVVNVI